MDAFIQNAQFAVIHQGRLWLARTHDQPMAVRASRLTDRTNFSPQDFDGGFSTDTAIHAVISTQFDGITGLESNGRTLTVKTYRGAFEISASREGGTITAYDLQVNAV